MPKVSGRELADQLIRRRPDMKVIYMSGYTDSAIVNSGILQKEVAFLQKPFTPTILIEKVRDVLENTGRTRHAGE
jgi:two-component system, cell cycle sensor histidine kinase and response regulator CckA